MNHVYTWGDGPKQRPPRCSHFNQHGSFHLVHWCHVSCKLTIPMGSLFSKNTSSLGIFCTTVRAVTLIYSLHVSYQSNFPGYASFTYWYSGIALPSHSMLNLKYLMQLNFITNSTLVSFWIEGDVSQVCADKYKSGTCIKVVVNEIVPNILEKSPDAWNTNIASSLQWLCRSDQLVLDQYPARYVIPAQSASFQRLESDWQEVPLLWPDPADQ